VAFGQEAAKFMKSPLIPIISKFFVLTSCALGENVLSCEPERNLLLSDLNKNMSKAQESWL
jgi:hypothetical protein